MVTKNILPTNILILLSFLSTLYIGIYNASAVIEIRNIEELQKIGNELGYPLHGEYVLLNDIDSGDTIHRTTEPVLFPSETIKNHSQENSMGMAKKSAIYTLTPIPCIEDYSDTSQTEPKLKI